MTNHLTIVQKATVRTAPNTGGGAVRVVNPGAVFDYQYILNYPSGDQWALLAPIDPTTQRQWFFGGAEVFVFVAVYVKGVEYAKLTPGTPQGGSSFDDGVKFGRNQAYAEMRDFISGK